MTAQTTYPTAPRILKGCGFASVTITDHGAPRLFCIDCWGPESLKAIWTLCAAGFPVRIHNPESIKRYRATPGKTSAPTATL